MTARKGLLQGGGLALAGGLLFVHLVSAQTTPKQAKAKLFQAYFDALAVETHTPKRGDLTASAFDQLTVAVPTMTTPDLQRAVSIIDASIDRGRLAQDGLVRVSAGLLLFYISGTKDGPALLAPEVVHLTEFCRDPFTFTGGFNMLVMLQVQYPELSVSAMLKAIEAPEANSVNGRGPAYATILLGYPRDGDLVGHVLLYMQRSDLRGQKLLDFLTGIHAVGMTDEIVEYLVHFLDDPQPEIRLAALQDMSGGGFAERKRLKPLFQKLAADASQSEALHLLAVELLDSNKMFYLMPNR